MRLNPNSQTWFQAITDRIPDPFKAIADVQYKAEFNIGKKVVDEKPCRLRVVVEVIYDSDESDP